jgi:hypothetical protein
MKLFGWKVKGLLDQVNVSVHLPSGLATKIQAAKIALLSGYIKCLKENLTNHGIVINTAIYPW